jgi:hypothetical protein
MNMPQERLFDAVSLTLAPLIAAYVVGVALLLVAYSHP